MSIMPQPKFLYIFIALPFILLPACLELSLNRPEAPSLPAFSSKLTFTLTVLRLTALTISLSPTHQPSTTPGKQLYVDPERRHIERIGTFLGRTFFRIEHGHKYYYVLKVITTKIYVLIF